MGYIFCLMGKSASGKDTIYQRLLERKELGLRRVIPYTTRPIREGEIPGETYIFCSEDEVARLEAGQQIIELRTYQTVYGPWKYFTANDGQIQLESCDYLLIGTLETYIKVRDYFGAGQVIPVYVEVEDGERLLRAIAREKSQTRPKYEEMCRRFLADTADFSEEKLAQAGICRRFVNERLEDTVEEISAFIRELQRQAAEE